MKVCTLLLILLIYGCSTGFNMTAADVSVLVDGKEQSNFGKVQVRFDENGAVIIDEHLQGVLEEFNVPVTVTPRVQHYLTYFTGKGRPIMQNWLNRSHRYMYLVKDIFQNEGAPLDLIALAFTESGFNPWAYSRAGAAGIWQFMRGTGKMYGLEVNDWVDERRDFEKATLAAAQHLNDLYEIFNDWYLALAAYNAGAGKITRATKAHGTTDFFEIASGRTLKPETRDYVPKYLAHLLIFNNLKEYGFKSPNDEILPLQFDSLELDSQVNIFVIAEILGCSPEELKDLNPALRTPMTPPVKKYTLRVPYGMKETATAFIQDNSSDLTRYIIYQAKTGDDLSKIAKMHNVSLEEIKKLNNFNYDTIYTSKIFFIPKSGIVLNEYDIAFAKEIATLAPKYYIVRKGDNFNRISRQHNIPLYTLVQLNPKVNPKRIYPGQVLIVSQGGLTS